jgi:drug/metabolite transporter (DMT)-like permease
MSRLLALAFIWGWSFLFIKVAGEGLSPATVAWGRIALGAVVLYGFLHYQGLRVPTDRTSLRHFAIAAVAGTLVPFTLLAWAEQHITSALTAVLNASTPLFTAMFSALALAERLRPMQLVGLGAGVVGVAVAAGLGGSDLDSSSLAASLAAIGAGVAYGVAAVYVRRHLVSHPPLITAAGQLTMGALLYVPVALGTSLAGGVALTPTRTASLLLLGALGTGAAFVLYHGAIAQLGATKATLVTYLVPVVALAVGIVVLDEPFEWRLLLGGGLIIGGIAAVNRRRAPSPTSSPAAASVTAGR